MKKIFENRFLLGLIVGLACTLLISVFLIKSQQSEREDYHFVFDPPQISPAEEMKNLRGDLTLEEFRVKECEVCCYYEHLYGYAKRWKIIDGNMTFEEFLKQPLDERKNKKIGRE